MKLFEFSNADQNSEKTRNKERVDTLSLEVKHLQERIQELHISHEQSIQKNQKFINDMLGDRIHFVQKLQVELSQRDKDLIFSNKKIKQLNFVVEIYKSQARQFNLLKEGINPLDKVSKI